jgi:hypothetical protein
MLCKQDLQTHPVLTNNGADKLVPFFLSKFVIRETITRKTNVLFRAPGPRRHRRRVLPS